ncbi:MAG: DUF3047 domain-containing protein [Rhodoferax sp.]|uniref:DUF3047 domain-containing protein n=1 Tax=Rhodoferax sp. TaxID=50421 RepID=UPI002ACF013B|nr:DUF3047 domain-containing protein [Rhodoferax sp.]MDZ7893301.1 DUF3047 domain-containing protein [Rhodoferax sp.]
MLPMALAQTQPTETGGLLQSWADAAPGTPPAPWRVVGVPGGKVPLLAPDIAPLEGQPVLRLRSDKSYGALSHAIPAGSEGRYLQWQWRLEQPLANADLRNKTGDDAALKVCALFDLPLEKIPFVERNLLRVARRVSGEALPGATLCYLWDTALPAGTTLNNAYTARVRLRVLNGNGDALGRWVFHKRDLHADFLAAFGGETDTVPPLLAIVTGADADNTGGTSLGFVSRLQLMKQ